MRAASLKNGQTTSCGCLARELSSIGLKKRATKHGGYKTRLYRIWHDMKTRCEYKKHRSYKNYGGNGISVCDAWGNSFANFKEWALLAGYNDSLSIDRINSNSNYEPNNCRWATPKEQANNTSRNVYITINGETLTRQQWAEKNGIRIGTIGWRIRNGWAMEESVMTPPTIPHGKHL